ncbi:MAG TPA: bifunctional diguanylate cyclase/phosphodiesterase [Solirubrobacteraceae bacterium]|jgi:diguanylate cyclase (GGDEF)-like protein|nr:bifunctional diguanylate cyclase/phosphodiesterase [Solirubrobacteraceae bacterium]
MSVSRPRPGQSARIPVDLRPRALQPERRRSTRPHGVASRSLPPARALCTRRLLGRISLTQKVALLSLVPMVLLGLILTRVIQTQLDSQAIANATQSARLIANIGIQPRLTPRELRNGLSSKSIADLDKQLDERSTSDHLARIKIWNEAHTVVYSDEHSAIGRRFPEEDDLQRALEGHPDDAQIITPRAGTETGSEVGLGELLEVYVPLRFLATGTRPVGAFEIYLSYAPIAASIARDDRMVAIVVGVGLALLWASLFFVVGRASRRLRRQSRENYVLARYDQLTGLPNRTLFRERVDATLARNDERPDAIAVLMIDLDGFKQINNTLGNGTGDEVLRETARRLQELFGDGALVARLGGDEYAVLCPRAEGVAGALATAAEIQERLEPPVRANHAALNVEASVGIAVVEHRGEDLDELLRRADTALARASAARSRVEVYSAERDSFDAERLLLLGEVRGALRREEFELHYQPKLDLDSGRVSGVEALVRWRHPEHGLLMPMTFIPLIEQTALVGPIALKLIDQALAQAVRWRRRGIDLDVAVNLSARNLLDRELPARVAALLARHEIPAARLTLEVTESATMADPERAADVLAALRASGAGVSIDDFGTGNASIGYLASLPATEVKIDRSFVTGVCDDARAEAIVRSIVELARDLELRVVAEGIETRAAMERLTSLGCDVGQGYFISRPLPAPELTAWLANAGAPRARARGAAPRRSSARSTSR